MVKKLKSEFQLQELQLYFNKNPQKWPKNQLIALSKKISLSRSQVYKWLWDQRNLMKQIIKNEANFSSLPDCFVQGEQVKNERLRCNLFKPQKYRKISLKSQFQEISMKVPDKLQFCSKLTASCSISHWAQHILRNHGTELIRTRLKFHHYSEKVERVNEFKEVKEEVL